MENRIAEILADSTIKSFFAKDGEVKVEVQLYTEEMVTVVFFNVKAFIALEVWGNTEDIGQLISVDKSILLKEIVSLLIKEGEKLFWK